MNSTYLTPVAAAFGLATACLILAAYLFLVRAGNLRTADRLLREAREAEERAWQEEIARWN